MTACNIIINAQNEFLVNGPLTMENVNNLLDQITALLANASTTNIVVNLQGVTQCDSSGVALLVALTREARQHQQNLQFIHAPGQLRSIINVSGLQQLLSVLS